MVQWQSPALEVQLNVINTNIIFLLLGLYGWEYFQTLDVELAVVRGRLSFRWPLIPYIVGRLFLFLFLLLLTIRVSVPTTTSFSCLPGVITTAMTGNISLACASANFMVRAWVIWKEFRSVHVLLLAFALGHWIVLALDAVNLQPTHQRGGWCTIYLTTPSLNAGVFVYSLAYDFLVLVLSIVGLSRQRSCSSLRNRLRSQGLVYFVIALVTYIPPTVFAFLGVNLVLVMTTGVSAITASTIASCRAVNSLLRLREPSSRKSTEESVETGIALSTQIPAQLTPPAAVY